MKTSVPTFHAKAPFADMGGQGSHTQLAPTPLVDGFNRQLTYLRLSVTDFCNFRCDYCLPNGYQGKRADDELTLAEIDTLFDGFVSLGTKKVRLTGGEPSVRRDLADIIALAKQHGIAVPSWWGRPPKLPTRQALKWKL